MHPNVINQKVERIKNSKEDINKFAEEYKPFIAACVKNVAQKYGSCEYDNELSIGFAAFVESIESYKTSQGNFLSFSQEAIKKSVIDYYKKERKYPETLFLKGNNDNEELDFPTAKFLEEYSEEEVGEYRRLELEHLGEQLKEWDIYFFDLIKVSPKQKSTRLMVSQVVRFILSRREILDKTIKSKVLPIADIEKYLNIPRKKIEGMQKYIIAVLLIYTEDYKFIKEYVNYINGM